MNMPIKSYVTPIKERKEILIVKDIIPSEKGYYIDLEQLKTKLKSLQSLLEW